MKFISSLNSKDCVLNGTKFVSFIVDKRNYSEYNSKNVFPNKELGMEEELSAISNEDETAVIKYLLEVMRKHGIITEDEYHSVLYKYS
ncbi:hypothetical protein IMSAGC011_00888 [Lachnospiraceae bacterium]|nr:hypothetical protein IMSAGC011_00888 [Lachnospiraceae bacterium]